MRLAMRRRGARESVVSLFAFQDVMASVIGILFFVVLLMAAYMTTTSPVRGETTSIIAEVEGLKKLIEEKETELSKARGNVRRASETVGLLLKDDAEIAEEIHELYARLQALHRTIQARRKGFNEVREELEARKVAGGSLDRRAVLLKSKVEKARREAAGADRTPRLSYIIGEAADNLEPWLVALSDKSVRVGTKDGTRAVLTFQAGSSGERLKLFQTWAEAQNPRTHYFVLLIRPSSVAFGYKTASRLKKKGFHVGTDLLPEDWLVLR